LWPSLGTLGLSAAGVFLALYVFMADAIHAVRHGESIQTMLPVTFNWPLFLVAWALMSLPAIALLRQYFTGPSSGGRKS
jgi:hypothetical protein